MSNLTTRKIVLGLLMALVLAFSVQGIADALTLTRVSDQVQSKLANSTFEITFSVGLTSPTIAYNAQNKRVSDHNAVASQVRIDSAGHEVMDLANGSVYRVIHTVPGFVPSGGTQVRLTNGAQPQYTGQANQAVTGPTPELVDTSGNVFTRDGVAVYSRAGSGTRDDTTTTNVDENDPFTYTRLRAFPLGAIDEEDRFDYNEETITVTSDSAITLKDKRDAQPVLSAAQNGTMDENSFFKQLRSSVTLVTDPLPAGTYTITITDATDDEDYPAGRVPTDAVITFTFHAVADTPATASLTFTDSAAGNLKTVDTAAVVEPVSNHFNLATATNLPVNTSIRYLVTVGSGRLYVGTPDREDTTPVRDLTVHKDATVYIKMNGTTNEVIAVVAGQDPRTHGKTLVYEYTGTGAPTNNQQQQQQQTTGSLNITVSGTGTTRTVTVAAISAQGTPVSILVTLSGTATSTQVLASGTETTITLPTTPGSYTLTATASVAGYAQDTETITVAGPTSLGTISISQIGTPTNGVQTFSITVRRIDGTTTRSFDGDGERYWVHYQQCTHR